MQFLPSSHGSMKYLGSTWNWQSIPLELVLKQFILLIFIKCNINKPKLMKFFLKSIFSVFIGSRLLIFLFYEGIHLIMNPLFDSDSPTPVVAFLSVTSKVAASASATRIFDIPFYFSLNEWHLLLEILAILSMILGNLIAITQTSMKRMLAYSSIGQIGYVIIGIIVGDSNGGYASMITYMLFYTSMNLGTFACIVSFGLRTGTDNIRDYTGLYTKDPFLALSLALSTPELNLEIEVFFCFSTGFLVSGRRSNVTRSLSNRLQSFSVCEDPTRAPSTSNRP
ncbi:hypothetical protein ACOSQ3_027869 [Xanthoceras sorbifolium]